MTDKIQKIREEVERLQKRAEHNFDICLTENERQFWLGESNVLTLIGKHIDSMQEEPTTSVWHDTRSEEPIVGRNIVMWHYDHMCSGEYLGEHFFGCERLTLMSDSKWAYFEDLKKL